MQRRGENFGRVWRYDVSHPFPDSPPGRDCICHDGDLPLDCTMVGARLHLGYRRIEYKGMELRGHEFHYSNVVAPDAMPSVAKQFTARGMEVSTPLYRYKT